MVGPQREAGQTSPPVPPKSGKATWRWEAFRSPFWACYPLQPPHLEALWGSGAALAAPAPAAARFGDPPALVHPSHPHLTPPPGLALFPGGFLLILNSNPTTDPSSMPTLLPQGRTQHPRSQPRGSPHPRPPTLPSLHPGLTPGALCAVPAAPAPFYTERCGGKAVFDGERTAAAKNSSKGNQCERAFVKIFFNGKTFFQLNY